MVDFLNESFPLTLFGRPSGITMSGKWLFPLGSDPCINQVITNSLEGMPLGSVFIRAGACLRSGGTLSDPRCFLPSLVNEFLENDFLTALGECCPAWKLLWNNKSLFLSFLKWIAHGEALTSGRIWPDSVRTELALATLSMASSGKSNPSLLLSIALEKKENNGQTIIFPLYTNYSTTIVLILYPKFVDH